MSDFFKEQLVKKEFSQKDRTKRIYIIGIAIAVAVFVWQICSDSATAAKTDTMFVAFMMLGIILIGIIAYVAFVKIRYLNQEFEYAYTNGSLDIDVIMNKSKRKTVFQGNATEFEVFAHIDDKEHLLEDGYDMNEIGSKYVDNFIKQVMDDGFFHADPHPGNVRIRDGKIVWIDMGMMGRLTERDREQIAKAVEGVAFNDIGMIQDAVLALGEFRGEPDPSQLYKDIRGLMAKYGTADMGNIDVAEVLQDLMDVMKENKITMPHGLTMLARGLAHVEGVLADISPQINMVEIAASRLKSQFIQNHDWKKEAKSGAKSIYLSMRKAVDIPALVADLLDGYMKGQTRINLDLHAGEDLANLLRRVTRNVVMGLWVMALLISSSIICTTDMKPKILGIPALGAIGYLGASVIVLYVFIKHIFSRK